MIRLLQVITLKSATRESVCVLVIITSFARMDNFKIYVECGVVKNLPVASPFSTIFINRLGKDIFQGKRKVVSYNCKLVQIMTLTMQTSKHEM